MTELLLLAAVVVLELRRCPAELEDAADELDVRELRRDIRVARVWRSRRAREEWAPELELHRRRELERLQEPRRAVHNQPDPSSPGEHNHSYTQVAGSEAALGLSGRIGVGARSRARAPRGLEYSGSILGRSEFSCTTQIHPTRS